MASLGRMAGPQLPFKSSPLSSGATNLPIDTSGSITVAGQITTLSLGLVLPLTNGSFSFDGQSVAFSTSQVAVLAQRVRPIGPSLPFQTGPRSYAVSQIQIDPGSISIDGQSVTFTSGSVLPLDAGSVTIAGQDSTFTATAINLGVGRVYYGPGPYFEFTPALRAIVLPTTALIQNAGAIVIAGQSVNFTTGASVVSGAVTYQGQSVNPTVGLVATVTPGSITIAGQTLSGPTLFGVTIDVAGSFSFSGQSVTLVGPAVAQVDAGSIHFAGQSVDLTEHDVHGPPKLFRRYRGYDAVVQSGDKKRRR